MNIPAEKTQENKSQAASPEGSQMESSGGATFQFMDNRPEVIAQRKLREVVNNSQAASPEGSQMESSGGATFQFMDNRPEAIAQRKLREVVDNSPRRVSQLKAFQDIANNSAQSKRAAQFQAMADNHSAQQQLPIQRQENKTGLPDQLKSGMESVSGLSLSDVTVHRNSDKPAQLQAHAYAQGTDIHLGPGQEKHLPHELGHVVQQKQGRVKPTVQLKGKVNINDDAGLEKEADLLGAKALQAKFITPDSPPKQLAISSSNQPFQLVLEEAGNKGNLEVGTRNPLLGDEEELGRRRNKEEIYSPADAAFNLEDYGCAGYIAHLTVLNGLLDAWQAVSFGEAIQDNAKINTLLNWNVASAVLNATGIGLGVATAVTFTCVTGGAGGVAILGVLTAWQFGVAASGVGLGFSVLKAVGTSEKPTIGGALGDIGKESSANGIGNADSAVGATTKFADTGAKIGGELVLGTVAAGLGGAFAAYGLYGDTKERAELKAKQAQVVNDLQNFITWLGINKSNCERMRAENNLLLVAEKSAEKNVKYRKQIEPVLAPTIIKLNLQIGSVSTLLGKMGKALPTE